MACSGENLSKIIHKNSLNVLQSTREITRLDIMADSHGISYTSLISTKVEWSNQWKSWEKVGYFQKYSFTRLTFHMWPQVLDDQFSTKGGRLCPTHYYLYLPPRFSDPSPVIPAKHWFNNDINHNMSKDKAFWILVSFNLLFLVFSFVFRKTI